MAIEYSDNYWKRSWRLWQHYRDEPFLDDNGAIADFPVDNNISASFKFETKIACKIETGNLRDVKIMVPLKYLSNSWRTLEIPLMNCEINLILTWSANCFIINASIVNQIPTFAITDTKRYVPVVTSSVQDNGKLL